MAQKITVTLIVDVDEETPRTPFKSGGCPHMLVRDSGPPMHSPSGVGPGNGAKGWNNDARTTTQEVAIHDCI